MGACRRPGKEAAAQSWRRGGYERGEARGVMRRNHAQPLNFSQTVRKGTFPDDEFLDAIVEDIGFEEPAAAQPHAAPPQPVLSPTSSPIFSKSSPGLRRVLNSQARGSHEKAAAMQRTMAAVYSFFLSSTHMVTSMWDAATFMRDLGPNAVSELKTQLTELSQDLANAQVGPDDQYHSPIERITLEASQLQLAWAKEHVDVQHCAVEAVSRLLQVCVSGVERQSAAEQSSKELSLDLCHLQKM